MVNSFQNEQETPRYESIAELAENVVYRVPGCDDLMVRKTLQAVYRDFCLRSCALRTERRFKCDSRIIPIAALTPDCDVETIASVRLHGRVLEAGRHYRTTSCHIELGRMFSYIDEDGVDKTFVTVEQVEVPRMGSERAPRDFISRYGDAIVSGTLMRLMQMTGKAWSDPQQAQNEAINYENFLTKARFAYYQDSPFANNALRADGESPL